MQLGEQTELHITDSVQVDETTRVDTMTINMGPQHPSTHGVLRLILTLEGETVVKAVPDIGYLHTGIEKTAESKSYFQALVVTDRMDYLAPLSNNLGYSLAVEKLLGIEEMPPKAVYTRVLLVELQRIASHLVWLGTSALDLGAQSMFLYCFREREMILDIFELVSGVRLMTSYIMPGGLQADLPPGFDEKVQEFLNVFPERLREYHTLLTNNQLWIERTKGVAPISAKRRLPGAVRGRCCAAAAWPGMFARCSRIRATSSLTLIFQLAATAMCMIAIWYGCWRWKRA